MNDAIDRLDISIIIPAKDEAKRLPSFLDNLIPYCQNSVKQYEIIVVDDGSSDNTAILARDFQAKFSRLKVIRLNKNRGKGYAVKTGLFEACGDIVLFLDADGSTMPDEIENNLHFLKEGYDIVIGSREVKDDKHLVTAKYYRKMIGQVFNFFVHLLLFKEIKDSQCGFKMFRKETIRPIFSQVNIQGFGFDLEVLYLAFKLDYRIKEVPVNWHHVDESKINLIMDSLRMFINIFQVRIWHVNPPVNMGTEESRVKASIRL